MLVHLSATASETKIVRYLALFLLVLTPIMVQPVTALNQETFTESTWIAQL